MDLSSFAARDRVRVTIKSPVDDEPLTDDVGAEMFVELMTSADPEYHTARREIRAAGVTDEIEFLTELAIRCVTDHHLVLEGKALEDEGVAELLRDQRYFWLRDQVVLEGNHRRNLFEKPPET